MLTGAVVCSALPSEAAVQVNPIDGLSDSFIKGADVSMIPEMEKDGAKFYDVDGKAMDCLQILKKHGVNWIRLRIWNDPQAGPGGGGNTDEARALAMAKRAKALDMKVLIDFHYSDWWADPGKQVTPKAWAKDDEKKLVKDVYQYTQKVVKDFQQAGVEPQMIQIGNEVKSGMLWPIGKLPSTDGDKAFAELMASGLQAVRDVDPDHQIKLMVHLPDGGDNAFYQSFFNSLIEQHHVNDFDVIGLSYYPFWHGSLDQLQQNLDDISARYNKDVIVVETAFGYTNQNFDSQKNCYGENEERIGGFRSTVQGQASGLRAVMERLARVPDGRGRGMFYWEPEWYAVPGAGWKTGEGDEWDNLTMFDSKGRGLESLEVFNQVSDKDAKMVRAQVKEVDEAAVQGGAGVPVSLPDKLRVTYTDDHAENQPVTWADPAPVFAQPGVYTVKGTISSVDRQAICKVTVIKKANLIQNPDFEKVNLAGWTITGDKDAVNAVSKAGDALGQGSMHYWADKAFHFTAQQSLSGLKDGKYTVAVSTQGGGGQSLAQLFVIGDNGQKKTVAIKDVGWNKWQVVTIKGIEIKHGKATVGVEMDAAPGNWGSLDDFEFYRQED
jgi:arabinogalactan endo-1,4-beta-galactosidase